jgi:uncharacterized protein (DUF3820 family)
MKYQNILEEAVKNKVSQDFFPKFDCTNILGKIDFAVKLKRSTNVIDFADEYLLWAETKQKPTDIITMLAQLVLTIGKAKTFNEILPPQFLGCYDNEKIAFVPYSEIQDIFYQNDFNWKVAPSNVETKEFKQIYNQIKTIIDNGIPWQTYLFYFKKDEKELRKFIKENFIIGKTETTKIKIDKNNFINVYQKWLDMVQPTIQFNWEAAKKHDIIGGDFFLADLISEKDTTLLKKLDVVLRATKYEMNRYENAFGAFTSSSVEFTDNQKAYNLFWAKYERPPKEDYWDYIIAHRHLLVPQDVREIKGSFFTPPQWVELSQEYLAKTFGEDWQDEYYIWDCAAGTGNLLAGLVNKDRIFASTLDKQDVDVMKQRIANGANLWTEQVFQFDFLNDDFLPKSKGGKLPDELFSIISDEKKRKKLIVYINPPYAEAANTKAVFGTGNIKSEVATKHKTNDRFKPLIGAATNDIASHFMARIYSDIPLCKLALFSKAKFICTQNYIQFRQFFKADFKKGFAVKSNSFDNVAGSFPIVFTIWDLAGEKFPEFVEVDIPEEKTKKKFFGGFHKSINKWIKSFDISKEKSIGYLICDAPDFQKIHHPYLTLSPTTRHSRAYYFNVTNLIEGCIYFAVRLCIKPTWLNDRYQFCFPNDNWKNDIEFQNDCLAFTLFHSQNRITVKDGANHWIPFVEAEVNAHHKFESHFMTSFINGKIKQNGYVNLFEQAEETNCISREFSTEAQEVFEAGKGLWKLYHKQPKVNVNASLYDIKEYFKLRNEKGNINQKSTNPEFNILDKELTAKLNILAQKIEPKVYEYGFLKE